MNESVASNQPKADIKLQDGLSNILRTLDGVARRSLDILISGLGMIILWPIFLFLALLIKRDSPGPVF